MALRLTTANCRSNQKRCERIVVDYFETPPFRGRYTSVGAPLVMVAGDWNPRNEKIRMAVENFRTSPILRQISDSSPANNPRTLNGRFWTCKRWNLRNSLNCNMQFACLLEL
jgi:hypothetical protein